MEAERVSPHLVSKLLETPLALGSIAAVVDELLHEEVGWHIGLGVSIVGSRKP